MFRYHEPLEILRSGLDPVDLPAPLQEKAQVWGGVCGDGGQPLRVWVLAGGAVCVYFLFDASLKKAHQSVCQVVLQLVTFPHHPFPPADTLYPTAHLSTPT